MKKVTLWLFMVLVGFCLDINTSSAQTGCGINPPSSIAAIAIPGSQKITIPVAFHVVLPPGDIAANNWVVKCQDLLAKMNQQYNDIDPTDIITTPYYTSQKNAALNGNMNIEFVMAAVSSFPGGGGVMTVPSTQIYRAPDGTAGCVNPSADNVKSSTTGGSDVVEPDQLLNIWVCDLRGCQIDPDINDYPSIGGYAEFPWCGSTNSSLDGVVINYQSVLQLTSTPTHEVGHWLGLLHTFGKNGLQNSDHVDDTTPEGWLGGKSISDGYNCANSSEPWPLSSVGFPLPKIYPAMAMNYMSYASDNCLSMFTNGQVTRVRESIRAYRPLLEYTDVMFEPNESAAAVEMAGHQANITHPAVGTANSGINELRAYVDWTNGDKDFYYIDLYGATTDGKLTVKLLGEPDLDVVVTDLNGNVLSSRQTSGGKLIDYCLDAALATCNGLIIQVVETGNFGGSTSAQPYTLRYYWSPNATCTATNTSGGGAGAPVTLSASSLTSCPGGQIVLTATGAASYDWKDANGAVWCAGCPSPQTVDLPSSGSSATYKVSADNTNCDEESVTITLNPNTMTLFPGSTRTIQSGNSTTIDAGVVGGNAPITYQWEWLGNNTATGANQTVSPSVTTRYYVTATDATGCQKTSSQLVNVVGGTIATCASGNPHDEPATAASFTPGTATSNVAGIAGITCATVTTAPARPACQANAKDVWFVGDVATTETYTITAAEVGNTPSNDLRMAIYTGPNANALTLQSCNFTNAGNTSTATLAANAGDKIWVRAWDNANADVVISVTAQTTVAPGPLPDLTSVGALTVTTLPSASTANGLTILDVNGATGAAGAHYTDVWFVPSTFTTPGVFPRDQAIRVWHVQVPGLAPSGNYNYAFTGVDMTAFNLPVGSYVVHVSTDASGQVTESNETNNWSVITQAASTVIEVVTVTSQTSPEGDLFVSDVSLDKSSYTPGEAVAMDFTVDYGAGSNFQGNTGGGKPVTSTRKMMAVDPNVRVYYSINSSTPDSTSDLLVATTQLSNMTTGSSQSSTLNFTLPTQAQLATYGVIPGANGAANQGKLWLMVDHEDVIPEAPDDWNNGAAVNYNIVSSPTRANYALTAVGAGTSGAGPGVIEPGESFGITFTAINNGIADASDSLVVSIYLGTQPTVAGTQQLVGTKKFAPLAVGQSPPPNASSVPFAVPCNFVPGDIYFMRLALDPNNDEVEIDEVDNDGFVEWVVDPTYTPTSATVFTLAPTTTCVGAPVDLAVSSDYLVNTPTNTVWDFGDGTVLSSGNAISRQHTYATAGTYTVTVTINGGQCNSAGTVITHSINVNPSAASQVSLTNVSDSELCLGTTLSVAASSVAGIDYLWDWNDGTFATTASATHTYTDPGTYDVSLLVSDNNGCEAATFDTTIVVKVTPRPVPEFSLPLIRCVGLMDTVFTNTPSSSPYIWDDGQGNVTTTSFPGIYPTYSTPGTYTLMLTASDACGVEDTAVFITVVSDIGLSAITIPNTGAGSADGEIDLIVNGGYAPFIYDWSNGETTEDLDSLTNGIYIVSVSDQVGCSSIDSFTVNSTTFPVSWLSITANAINTTDAEVELVGVFDQDNEEVTLEYSRDGIIWKEIEQKTISPDIGIAYPVTFIHYDAAVGTNYAIYRGRGTDQDGNFNYTPKVEVYWKYNEFSLLNIFPNPAHDQINIHYTQENKRRTVVSVYNMVGQLVSQKSQISNHSGAESFSIDTQSFPEGIYLIVLSNDKDRHHMKFVVEH
ncbi:MAG: PKD domain-containing protein [Bacteroidia bacterium]|nr:PKD domain-containing protein [Bacteroidia bacterium]